MMLHPLLFAPDVVAAVTELERLGSTTPWTAGVVASELASDQRRYVGALRLCENTTACAVPHLLSGSGDEARRADLLGFAGIALMLDDAHVMEIVVHPAWQHQGVGRALLAHLADEAVTLGCSRMTLEVRADASRTRRIYAQAGFVEVGTRPGYYPDGEPAIIATRELAIAAAAAGQEV